jgi:hypothetical protein
MMSAAADTFVVPEGFAVDLRRAVMLKQAQEIAQRTGCELIDALLRLEAAQREGVAAHERWMAGRPAPRERQPAAADSPVTHHELRSSSQQTPNIAGVALSGGESVTVCVTGGEALPVWR